jgi:hypothetical protein
MGAALGLKLWDTLHFGFDLILQRAATAPASVPD